MKGNTKKLFRDGLFKNNPVFIQILGICSTLAVTNRVKNTVVMVAGLLFVVALSNLTISLLRKAIPSRVRMMAEVLIIASFVIIVDIVLKAYLWDISKQLGPYVGLIITNCIIMGRAEAFAISNPPWPSFLDGIASGLGYAYVLVSIAIVRELLGNGTLWEIQILGDWWVKWTMMVMASGAFFMLALFIWIMKGVVFRERGEA
ncbi:MAG TPA: NADH:ubiquinone reductase (Na(+)-transporting) subunit D [Candidatus Mcinerneyibacteriales bacterium]|nr:NADH:ubiquinone reductase (Na(+)-transporting) subunit D [Candidatus Mcinerneyibacteriales bacterium]HPE20766.1 NADH:ubiquinone reductase (Na(+)-transporting) subunit D [Candidatus Mcinerneyibacteriales bacterium]HPJ69681.1 NADH:ubiquinone reductase (Na(+)-transporting) subunit D [Candidatus Mcinerneyibacteriales bacterium]HPQ88799.1 NADH:ubiquinone reductase (Na(+)-transporting) subunit D [Candidatus Mcinerneyibacteriales bacterium]